MIVEVKVPILAESVAEATLMSWHKTPGAEVRRGDSLIDIETDKVTLEVAAPHDGVLVEILKADGEEVGSDEVIAKIDTQATVAAPATTSEPETPPPPEPEPQQQSLPVDEGGAETKLSPAVRSLLVEQGLDASDIAHRGERLTKEDVLNHLADRKPPPPAAPDPMAAPAVPESTPEPSPVSAAPAPEPAPAPKPASASIPTPSANVDISGARAEERAPMTRLRKRAAQRLLSAQRENAILTTFNEVNMQPVMALRNKYKDEFEKIHHVKLGFMSFFTRAAVEALKKFPIINASVDGDDIVYHGYFDVGIAVSSPRGLVVPIVRNADALSFAEIEATIGELGQKARDAKLMIEDLTGGTFTITNGGVFGSLLSTPIINPPQSAILGMHKIQERPVAENGEILIRPMMYLALSYDHRIIDGKEAVSFLVTMKTLLEEPARLLLQV